MAEQTQLVEMPDGTQVEFPSSMPDEEIGRHVQRYIGNTGASSPIAPPPISGVPRPATAKLHKSFLVGDENDDPDDPDTKDPAKSLGDAVVGAGKSIYSASAPNVAHQLLRKVRGQSADLVSPVENAIGMMAGEEGLISGGADAAPAMAARRAASPAGESTAAAGQVRSFPAKQSSPAGAAAGQAAGPTAIDLLKAGSKLIPGVGKVAHAADFASTAMQMLRRAGGDSSPESAPVAAAAEGQSQLAPHESTAVPQTFPSTGRYPVSGRPLSGTNSLVGGEPINGPPLPHESPAEVDVDEGGASVKNILQKKSSGNSTNPAANAPNDEGPTNNPAKEPTAGNDPRQAVEDVLAKNRQARGKLKKTADAMIKGGTGAIDDAAVASTNNPKVPKNYDPAKDKVGVRQKMAEEGQIQSGKPVSRLKKTAPPPKEPADIDGADSFPAKKLLKKKK